jgi:hypothetical protein
LAEQSTSPEELLRKLKVSDLLLSTLATLAQLGFAKLAERDTEQARLAIESLRALTPILEGTAQPEALRDLRQATANLQLAYADAVATRQPEEKPEPEAGEEQKPDAAAEDDAPG